MISWFLFVLKKSGFRSVFIFKKLKTTGKKSLLIKIMAFIGKFLCVFSRSGSFLFLAIILLELTQTRSYFRMFVREPKVKPVHILENSF